MQIIKWLYILGFMTVIIITDELYALNNNINNAPNQRVAQQTLQENSNKTSTYSTVDKENTYRFLLAEIALQENNPAIALENYIAILKTSQDTQIAELALECAIKYKFFTHAVEIAILWADFAKDDINPQLIAITLLLDHVPEKAKIYINNALALEPTEIDQYLLFAYKKLPPNSQKNLYVILRQLIKEKPKDPYVHVATAQIAAQQDDIQNAEALVNQALQLQAHLTHAIQLKAKLIRYKTNEDLAALNYLRKEIIKNPNNEELLMFYSNALLDNNDLNKALPYLQKLTKSKTFATEAQFTLGEYYLEQQDYNKAKAMLIKVINDPAYGSQAKYNLGQICEQQNNNKDAMQWYLDIKEGQFHVPAVLKTALLLAMEGSYNQAIHLIQNATPTTFIEQKQLILVEVDLLVEIKEVEQAMDLISDVLAVLPHDTDFLYARSLIASLLNLPKQTEQDLETILSIEPENANALNALGYTLANQPERTEEALAYIKKAIELSPNNPAFMDSMGWVLFNAGKIQDSIIVLEGAYDLSKDSEIAAHLGEVLWTTGNKEQAKKIWHEALQNTPHHDTLLETLNRLKVKLNSSN